MAKVPDLKRVTVEDFDKEDQNIVQKLGFIINSFHEQVRNALNRNIDFENLNQEIKTLDFTTNPDGQPINRLSFRSNLNTQVQGIIPVRVQITSNNTQVPTVNPIFSWSQNGATVTITNISGLLPETKYNIRLLTL